MDDLKWFKSSHSGGEGGQCVEVAYNWRKSTHSDASRDCIEVAAHPTTIHVRDSKDKAGPILDFTPEQWSAFVEFARAYPTAV
jgi:hypothetical protein